MSETSPPPSLKSRAVTIWRERVVPRRKRLVWVVAGVLVIVATYFAIRSPAEQQGSGRGRFGGPMPVATAKVERGDVPITLNALGTVTPLATVTVRSQIAGLLTEVSFQEGQMVKKGDLLALVDPRPYQHALEQAQGQLERDRALLKNAELDAARYKTLFEQDSIARQQVDTQNALVLQYKGTVQTDQAQVDTARLNLNYCYIKAPLTGRVGLRLVDSGNYISVGDANGIAVITQMAPITVIFTVPEDVLPQVLQRFRQKVELPVTAYDRGMKNVLAKGVVTTIDNQIDTTTGTVKLRAEFPNTDETLFPNQFVNIALLVDTVRDAMIVPVSAIQRGAPGTFVYLVNADNTVAVRPVTLGVQSGERVAVTAGLALNDAVVTDGADRLTEGAKIIPPGQDKAVQGNNGEKPTMKEGQKEQKQERRGEGRRRREGEGAPAGGQPSGGPPPGGP